MSISFYSRMKRRHTPKETLVSRRDFLRQMALASGALLLSNCAPGGRGGSEKSGHRIVIIGAGFAGLAAAFELKAAGYDVVLLEARERAGGRVLSFADFPPSRNVEGGAELIGSNHPTWVSYAERFGLDFLDVAADEEYDEPFLLQGRVLDPSEVEGIYEELDAAAAAMTEDARAILADLPWTSPGAAELDARSTAGWLNGLSLSDLGRYAAWTELGHNNGMAPERQSYLGNLAQVAGGGLEAYWTDSEVYRCRGGNQQLALRLAAEIGPERIHYRAPVANIAILDDLVRVTTAGGEVFEGEEVILAVPPTVWKKITVTPAIPADLVPQMGTSVKYLAQVRSRFWYPQGLSQYVFADAEPGLTWEATDAQAGDTEIVHTSFSSGEVADRMRARTPEERDQVMRAAIESVLPGYDAAFVRSRFMNWPSDEWTMGGYSFPAPGEVTTLGPRLREGLPRLHFAGEHTSYAFIGYMEGGLNSGASLARRIAERDGRA